MPKVLITLTLAVDYPDGEQEGYEARDPVAKAKEDFLQTLDDDEDDYYTPIEDMIGQTAAELVQIDKFELGGE